MIKRLKLSGIYGILNIFNKKIYVGSAVHLYQRWRDHKLALNTIKHHNILLQRAWNNWSTQWL
jgi:GIY-YIG catalytic domain